MIKATITTDTARPVCFPDKSTFTSKLDRKITPKQLDEMLSVLVAFSTSPFLLPGKGLQLGCSRPEVLRQGCGILQLNVAHDGVPQFLSSRSIGWSQGQHRLWDRSIFGESVKSIQRV
jgi:hypothetical protein